MRGYDIIIVGSSFIGITTAIMLAKLERIRVAIVTNDADVISMLKDNTYNFNRSSASTNASKLLAIANSSYELLKECGVGDALQKNSQKINHIRVVDDDSYAKVDFAPHDIGVDCFGYMIDERVLKAVLCEKFYKLLSENTNFHVFQSDQIASIRANTYNISLNSTLVNVVENEACSTLQAQLIVGCDGRNSIVRNLSYIGTNIKDYDQTAIVVDISHQNWPHDGVAVEKFTPAGPFAVLPKHDNDGTQSSLVWIERGNIKSDDLNKLGATAISDLIRKKLAGYLGDIDVISEPSAHQLKLVQAKQRYAKRVVLLGDAAQSIHPVAGQGVNLGLRDVKSFISIVQQHHSIGLDVGAADVLKEYATSRELDVQTMIFATTSLVKLFSNDFLPLKILRRCGLKLFDKLDYLKKHAMLYAVGCKNCCYMKTSIYTFEAPHIPAMSEAFNQIGWNKPVSLFTGYLKEQEAGERLVWVAHIQDRFAGYVTLKWQSQYPLFKAQNIPEIMDLNVLPGFRKIGIGSLLLDTAEKAAAMKSSIVGLGVGLYSGYGAAQRLYIKRGYIPDGRGITYDGIYVEPGSVHRVDDNLILWLIKRFQRCSNSNIS